jgi:hypothetical protein
MGVGFTTMALHLSRILGKKYFTADESGGMNLGQEQKLCSCIVFLNDLDFY